MNENGKLIKESIVLAIDAIKDDICEGRDPDNNKTRAEAIKALTEAYKNINRRK